MLIQIMAYGSIMIPSEFLRSLDFLFVTEQKSRNSYCFGLRKTFAAFTKDCLITCLLYGMFSITDIGFIELLPVYLATSRDYGGLGKLEL